MGKKKKNKYVPEYPFRPAAINKCRSCTQQTAALHNCGEEGEESQQQVDVRRRRQSKELK